MGKKVVNAVLDTIMEIDESQARRYAKLQGDALDIATAGIVRHIRACRRMKVNPDHGAIREIIDDAMDGRRYYEPSNGKGDEPPVDSLRGHSSLVPGPSFFTGELD